MPFCLFKTPQPSISLFFILIYSITIHIKYTLTKCENNIFRKISKIFNSNPLSATMVWQGVWCNFGLILCKNSLKLHKNKNFCISDFSKNLTFLTNLANILNFICQICKFFKQSSPTSQPSVAHRFIKILKSSIDKRNIFDIMNNVLKITLKKCGIWFQKIERMIFF